MEQIFHVLHLSRRNWAPQHQGDSLVPMMLRRWELEEPPPFKAMEQDNDLDLSSLLTDQDSNIVDLG